MTQVITALTREDKKLILQGISLRYYKVFHAAFVLVFITALLITAWKFNKEDIMPVAGLFIWLLIFFNFLFLTDYLFHKIQIAGAKKKIITGMVTNIYESGTENGGTIICFDTGKFDITWARRIPDIVIGDTVSLHYVSKKNGKEGILFLVEKTGCSFSAPPGSSKR